MLSYQKLDADCREDILSWPRQIAAPGDLMSQTNSVDVDVLVVGDVDGRSGR